jgi:ATP-dependent exoDNAse (exonuclease V) alpha subunit
MIITATNKDRSILNKQIREELRNSEIGEMKVTGDFEFPVLESNSLGGTSKSIADSYEIGNRIQIDHDTAKQYGIDDKQLGTILEIDKSKNNIIVQFNTETGEQVSININPSSKDIQFSAFRENVKPFGVNDKIVFLKNDNTVNVRNGQLAIIKEINEAGDVVADMAGEKVKFNLNEYRNIDHAYCLSEYKSQGATVSRLVWHADTKSGDVSSNSFYVAITRCTHEIALYTDNATDLAEKTKREQFKYSTVGVDFMDMVDEILPEKNQPQIDLEDKRFFDIGKIKFGYDTETKNKEVSQEKLDVEMQDSYVNKNFKN